MKGEKWLGELLPFVPHFLVIVGNIGVVFSYLALDLE